jgi:acyl carrier protein
MNEVEARIAQLLTDSVRINRDTTLTPDTRLLEGGLELDSVELLELVVAIEEAFDTTVEDAELTVELFETVRTLGRFIQGKRGVGP